MDPQPLPRMVVLRTLSSLSVDIAFTQPSPPAQIGLKSSLLASHSIFAVAVDTCRRSRYLPSEHVSQEIDRSSLKPFF